MIQIMFILEYSNIQGSNAVQISIDSGGRYVFLNQNDSSQIYDIKKNKIMNDKMNKSGIKIFDEYLRYDDEITQKLMTENSDYFISQVIKIDSDNYIYLTLYPDSMSYRDLYVVKNNFIDKKEYAVFPTN